MGLFGKLQLEKLTAAAVRSQQVVEPKKQVNARSIKEQITAISEKVLEHFADSMAELITSAEQLHTYIDHMIICGIGAIDTETTGLDRLKDHIVGWSLYFPDNVEVYIPCKHIVPIFDNPYKQQLTYEQCAVELQRLVTSNTKLVFANADFDLSMIWKDFHVDLVDVAFFDVILAWRCLKENEQDNTLKGLYTKYIARGTIDKMKFSDFFTADLFPYCDPQVAKLYAAADAKYTFEFFKFEMQYLTKDNPKCKKFKFEAISDLVFGIENPLIKVCQMMHRRGVYLEQSVASMLQTKYNRVLKNESDALRSELKLIMDNPKYYTSVKCPFGSIQDFNPLSPPHVEWLVYDVLKLDTGTKKRSTKKEILSQFNVPIIKNILKYRSLNTLISTFVDKLPKTAAETPDHKVHCEFKSIGADCVTGDTIIPTKYGYYTAEELCKKAEKRPTELIPTTPFHVITMDNEYDWATDIIYYPDTPTVKVNFDCGLSIEGTPNHPIICALNTPVSSKLGLKYDSAHWTHLSNVYAGMYVKVPCNYFGNKDAKLQLTNLTPLPQKYKPVNVVVPKYYTSEFAEFLGMYNADGTAYMSRGAYRIKITNNNPDVINRTQYLAKALFHAKPKTYALKANPNEVDTWIVSYSLYCLDTILDHGAGNKRIPKAIWYSPLDVINAYIRGMTLDSYLSKRKDGAYSFNMTVANDTDASLIQQHLLSQGILCSKQRGHVLKVGRAVILHFDADNYIRFRDTIGFIETDKIMDIAPSMSSRHERYGDFFFLKVKSIEHKRADVYDLSVPITHSFVGNAIICHNTGRFSSKQPKQAYWAV